MRVNCSTGFLATEAPAEPVPVQAIKSAPVKTEGTLVIKPLTVRTATPARLRFCCDEVVLVVVDVVICKLQLISAVITVFVVTFGFNSVFNSMVSVELSPALVIFSCSLSSPSTFRNSLRPLVLTTMLSVSTAVIASSNGIIVSEGLLVVEWLCWCWWVGLVDNLMAIVMVLSLTID
uniref:Transmembrane protein n=1 Tax=Glossina austeni TaxID=7395 RepID=A0A1A9VV85_GLOAU